MCAVCSLLFLDTQRKTQIYHKYQAALLLTLGYSFTCWRLAAKNPTQSLHSHALKKPRSIWTNIWDSSNLTSPSISVGGSLCVPAIKENVLSFNPEVLFVLSAVSNGLAQTISTKLIVGTKCQRLCKSILKGGLTQYGHLFGIRQKEIYIILSRAVPNSGVVFVAYVPSVPPH